jgi:type IV pilus assembly protein PilO
MNLHSLFNQLAVKHKVILAVCANVLFILLFYFGLIVPQNEKITQAMTQMDTEKQKVLTVENFAASRPNLDQYLNDLDIKMAQINSMLPNNPEMSDFLKQAEQYARETGLALIQVHTGQIANKNGYREIPVEISVQGSYLQTVNFVKKLEDGTRFVVVRNIQMNSQNNAGPKKQTVSNLPATLQLGTQQTIITSKLSTAIFGYGVPPQAKAGQPNQSQNGQTQNAKK